MMVPNQIKMQNFSPVGRGAYKAAEVDGFMQRVYAGYSELYSENAELKKKFSSLRDIIEEYNAGKNAIATALVKAQAVADETVKNAKNDAQATLYEAEEKAKKLVEEKTKEADSYAAEKKKAAEESFEKAKADLERIMEQTKEESEKYIAQINEKARQIIEDANEKAANIVAAAYGDAKKANDLKNEIIASTQKELSTVKSELSSFKKGTIELLGQLLPKLEALSIPEFEVENDAARIPEEKISVTPEPFDEPFAPAPVGDESDFVAPVVEEENVNTAEPKEENAEEVKAYIPDADEYVKQIFDGISLLRPDSAEAQSDVSEPSPETENKNNKEKKSVGYNGNNTGFTVTDDIDILSDDE